MPANELSPIERMEELAQSIAENASTLMLGNVDEQSDCYRAARWAVWQTAAALSSTDDGEEGCDHAGWNFKQHGRCCFKCGAFMVDFGD